MRGEHGIAELVAYLCEGSSPHARGTQVEAEPCPLAEGIIPACAGNTCRLHGTCLPVEDHPRMRGEHICSWGI